MDADLVISTGFESGHQIPTSVLRVALLHVTQSLNKHLDGDILVIGEEMLLGGISSKVDERVGIRCDTSETSEDVAVCQF
jgi:hypothetical protein